MAHLLLWQENTILSHGVAMKVAMKHVVLPLTWFVLLFCVVALASGLSLSLV